MSTDIRLPRVLRFPVEAGHIQLFARAVGDANPIYSDPDYASRSAMGGIIAPPTFSEASNHFDEDWPYRPRWDPPGYGSAATPPSESDGQRGTAMHAETHFVYHRPMRPGMVLSVRARPGKQWQKWGARSGSLKFHEIVSEFHEADGTPVLECTTVVLQTGRTVTGAPAPRPDSTIDESSFDTLRPVRERGGRPNIKTGDKVRSVLVRELNRGQIVQYAGVSGDFSPQHVDEAYNTQVAGYPSVFAHGMLTMGMVGRALTDFVGDGKLKKFGFQFRQQVWPGDSLFAVLEVTGMEAQPAPSADMTISVTNQHGHLIGRGYAKALIDD